MANTIQDWDADTGHVDPEVLQGDSSRDYIGAESVVIAAGPASISSQGDGDFWQKLFPIGIIQNASIAQSRQLQQLFEIGSFESYFIPGKTFVNCSFSRVLIHGPNLLKAFYKWHVEDGNGSVEEDVDIGDAANEPGSHFYINLASRLFAKPLGLLLYMQDTEKDDYSSSYIENAFIQSHQMSVSAQQTLIMENVQVRASKIVPIDSATSGSSEIIS